ncbi:hypothetical protein RRG08_018575 [Elysia crispata]|uniref:Uncharacterized protein n=1 Tax=Elysia crispata TaxID=231223 RepID=A0AAE0XZJ8_9GAST|nr:hypothetical protein RRG08_018575 [Elysia crispata]
MLESNIGSIARKTSSCIVATFPHTISDLFAAVIKSFWWVAPFFVVNGKIRYSRTELAIFSSGRKRAGKSVPVIVRHYLHNKALRAAAAASGCSVALDSPPSSSGQTHKLGSARLLRPVVALWPSIARHHHQPAIIIRSDPQTRLCSAAAARGCSVALDSPPSSSGQTHKLGSAQLLRPVVALWPSIARHHHQARPTDWALLGCSYVPHLL